MENNKQTAVEWLIEQLECFGNKHELQLSWATVDDLVEQAKEMEKGQIIKAVDSNFSYDNNGYPTLGEQYYNEIYKK